MGPCAPGLLRSLFVLAVSIMLCPTNGSSVLKLERALPMTHEVDIERLVVYDKARHTRLLQGFVGGVVDFSVVGSSDPYLVGLYFTKVQIGSPPRQFNVQIDTGSDVLWVNCNSCSNCPQSSGLGIQLNFFDSSSSSTAGLIFCSDQLCTPAAQTAAAPCSSDNSQCSYSFQYGDGSGTSGYYVSDVFYFDTVLEQSVVTNSSSLVVFGCSTYQSGDLTKTDKAVDGIFGFGPGVLSVVSQLSSRGITPKVFSHCLKGDGRGGGILVLGEILEPGIVYSPLVPSQPHYNLYLQSIAVNGQLLQINPAAFMTGISKGTIIDSGTTLAYLVDEAFDALAVAVTEVVSQYATPTISNGNQCYLVTHSVSDVFPVISFNFAGDASLILKPGEYLVPSGYYQQGGAALWCIGFVRSEGLTILGDLVLKDKIFVYDLAHRRIGWTNYDCSTAVNVSTISAKDYINAGQLSISSSSRDKMIPQLQETLLAILFLPLVKLTQSLVFS